MMSLFCPNPIQLAVLFIILGATFGILVIISRELSLIQIISALAIIALLNIMAKHGIRKEDKSDWDIINKFLKEKFIERNLKIYGE